MVITFRDTADEAGPRLAPKEGGKSVEYSVLEPKKRKHLKKVVINCAEKGQAKEMTTGFGKLKVIGDLEQRSSCGVRGDKNLFISNATALSQALFVFLPVTPLPQSCPPSGCPHIITILATGSTMAIPAYICWCHIFMTRPLHSRAPNNLS